MPWASADQREADRRYRERHRDEINARNRARRAERGAEHRAVKKAWREANPEKVAAYTTAARKRYYARHGRKASAAWEERNRETVRARNALKESRRRAQKRGSPGTITASEWAAIKAKQRERCAYCNARAHLHMDHVIPLARGGCHMAHNIVGACKPCNSRKHDRIVTAEVSLFDAVAQ
jgi:5-methylcytosine-specific restriction endonuclease McrA